MKRILMVIEIPFPDDAKRWLLPQADIPDDEGRTLLRRLLGEQGYS